MAFSMSQITVLTGDLIASTEQSSETRQRALKALELAADGLHTEPSPFARRGGDGWQIVTALPEPGFVAALSLRACLMRQDLGIQTRIAIATGPGEIDPNNPDPNAQDGPVYIASGRLLETLKGRTTMADAAGGALGAVTRLADHISQGWTAAQARAVAEALQTGDTREEIAGRLGISRPAVDQALWAAGWPALQDAWDMIGSGEP